VTVAPETATVGSSPRTTVFCRDAARRSLIERLVPGAAVHGFAVDATLGAMRSRADAIVLDLGAVEGREADLVRSLHRARPDARVYLLVGPHAEPLARDLLKVGASDYLVLPDGIHQLPDLLARGPGPAAPAAPPPAGTDWKALFDAACDLASLAAEDADAVLREGLRILVRATHAVRGTVFTRVGDADRLDACAWAGEPLGPEGDVSDAERSAAACALGSDAASIVHLAGRDARGASRPPVPGERPGTVIALPLRADGGPFGAVCLVSRQDAAPDRAALDALERLVGALARAFEAAGRQRG
jgi:hypothetical protein